MLKTVSSTTNALGSLNYKGTWNASTNSPTLASGVGTKGDYYVVSVSGTTALDGISNWGVGDWATYNGSVWQRVEGGADLNGVNLSVSGNSDMGNIRVAGNTISSTNTNGDINLTPNGAGSARLPNPVTIGTGSAAARLGLQSSAAGGFEINWSTGTTNRWVLEKAGAETGSDAGSNLALYRYNDAGGFAGTVMTFARSSGSVTVIGALSKGSGSFRIDHPLPEKEATHQLVHSFIEGPQIDLIYRGKAKLVNGTAQINIDEKFGMTAGTFVALCRDTQCFTSNEEGWHCVRGSVADAVLTIECEDATCTDTVSWMVIGERHDKHIMNTDWTDENGKIILEPLKSVQSRPHNLFTEEGA
jgi:hypothetical protein